MNWLVKRRVRKIEDIGKIMREYYLDSNQVLKFAEKNKKPRQLF